MIRRAKNRMTGTPPRVVEVSLGERAVGRGVRIDFDCYRDRYACFDNVDQLRELALDLEAAIRWMEGEG